MKFPKQLIDILKLGNQYDKKSYLLNIFSDFDIREDEYGNIYVNRDFNTQKPYLCSHIDTVDEQPSSKKILYDPIKNSLFAERQGKPCNLGADDGVGVYACIKLFKEFDIGLAFFLDEEKGCLGSKEANPNFINASYLIQLDRKGTNEIVFGTSWSVVASDDFISDVSTIADKYNYKSVDGGLTDVITLVDNKIVQVSACNVSCGYYKPHTSEEYILIDHMNKAISLTRSILTKLGNYVYSYEFVSNYGDHLLFDDYLQIDIRYELQSLIDSNLSNEEIIDEIYNLIY
jgi:hypothetical protein